MALALLYAVTTAAAHALWKAGRDRMAVRALIGLTSAIVMAPLIPLAPLPTAPMLPWLLLASALHTIYQLVLVRSYAINDFAVGYPIARGVTPIATTALGVAWLGDRLDPLALVGVGLVSAGIMLVAAGRAIRRAGLLAA